MAIVHGRAFITINGKRYNSKEGATLKIGGAAREPVVGDSGLAGYQEKNEPGQLDATLIATKDVSITELQAIVDANVTFDSDNGKSYVASDAFIGALPELSKDGIKVTIHGTFKEA